MVWQILLCALAASGVLALIWIGVGMLLMPFSAKSSTMVLFVDADCESLEQQIRAFSWLVDCGLLRTHLLLVVSNAAQWALASRFSNDFKWVQCVWQEDLTEALLQLTDGGADFFDNK